MEAVGGDACVGVEGLFDAGALSGRKLVGGVGVEEVVLCFLKGGEVVGVGDEEGVDVGAFVFVELAEAIAKEGFAELGWGVHVD